MYKLYHEIAVLARDMGFIDIEPERMYSIAHTVYPTKQAHNFVELCFILIGCLYIIPHSGWIQ